ncbi:peroxynitrite isomerase THAP4-like [Aethina tumida]|uniref:peroxynitrite isomerase THAP4-like n=1 Tax=Aethina tumida TaxID=116153 RepID=UPI0021473EF4|nr:peroxynitrite isomerase THAP4-like [Aethina tumida]
MRTATLFKKVELVTTPINEAIKPMLWLMGTWKAVKADGFYPTMKPFKYGERMKFVSIGQPNMFYSSITWKLKEKTPWHLECGYLRIKPKTCEVNFLVTQNFGLSSVDCGTVEEGSMTVSSDEDMISRITFASKPFVKKMMRCYRLNDKGELEYTMFMETTATPMTQHLDVLFKKEETC